MSEPQQVLTHGGPDRKGKLCQCIDCGFMARCTITSDFYTRDHIEGKNGPLYCESCITRSACDRAAASPSEGAI